MKKILMFSLLLIGLNFIVINDVSAEGLTCKYYGTNTREITLTVDESGNKIVAFRSSTGKVSTVQDAGAYMPAGWTSSDGCPKYVHANTQNPSEVEFSNSKTYDSTRLEYSDMTFEQEKTDAYEENDGTNPDHPDYDAPDRFTTEVPAACTSSILGDPSNEACTAYWLQMILDIMKYIAIAALVVLTIVDFFKAVASQDADALSKAVKSTVTRFIWVVVLFFFPIILELILEMVGVYGDSAGALGGLE